MKLSRISPYHMPSVCALDTHRFPNMKKSGASWHGGPVEFFRVVRGLFLLAGAWRGNGPAMQDH